MPKFPPSLRKYPEPVAREMYKYRVVRKAPARLFCKEYENAARVRRIARLRKQYPDLADKDVRVKFSLGDTTLFLFQVAGYGILSNLAYDVLKLVVRKIRKPRMETGRDVQFETAVSRKTYNRIRREYHPGKGARRKASEEIEEELETSYKLMVTLVNPKTGKPTPLNRELDE